jgi:hypothetical protein
MFCGYDNAVKFAEKSTAVDLFFSTGATDRFRKELLKQNAIQLILATKNEEPRLRQLVETGIAREVFRNRSTVIFYAALDGKRERDRSEIDASNFIRNDIARMNMSPVKK